MKAKIVKAHSLGFLIAAVVQIIGLASEFFNQRGLWHGLKWLGKIVPEKLSFLVLALEKDIFFPISLKDPYWSRLLYSNYHYEPEIKKILFILKDKKFDVFDCGANYGYWSLYFSSDIVRAHRTISIESNPNSYEYLLKNISENQRKNIIPLNLAISNKRGTAHFLIDREHADCRIVDFKSSNTVEVQTDTLQSIIEKYKKEKNFLIKLDVEGAEISALQTLNEEVLRNTLLIYEDHGKDEESLVSRFVLENLGMEVFFIKQNVMIPIYRALDLSKLKNNKKLGYNLIAFRTDSELGLEIKKRFL